MNMQDDIIDLQTRLAYQEDLLTELNRIVTSQDAEILTLQRQIKHLAKRLEEFLTAPASSGVEMGDERPPHY